jgi:deazaflavin-dependent oxidoreductase (nitroreductase family)
MQSDTSARLKRVAGRQTVRLTHYGRRSGKPFQVTIWFVLRGDKVYIGTAKVNRQWVRNVQKTPQVKLSIGGEDFEGTARFLSDPAEIKRAQSFVAGKYWMFSPILLFGKLLGAIGVMRDASGFFEVTLTGLTG